MSGCTRDIYHGLSEWEGSRGKSIRRPHMGAIQFLYEGNMNALTTDVYEGQMSNSRVRMCFFAV